jgi:threonine dehydrogenase-like Zn-dependent dehydrogenase
VLFLSDAVPTGYMGADFCNIKPGDTVAVWGCGGVGIMAQRSAYLLGAERVIGIDRFPERLQMAKQYAGSEIINYTEVDNVLEVLKDLTGGRGPDSCIDAVGMEAHGEGLDYAFDRVKQGLRLETDRGQALREAILACRKGGTLSILGVYGVMDKFPLGVIMNKGLTVRTAQQHGQKYLPRLIEHVVRGELDPSFLATHRFPLEDSPRGYEMFKNKEDGCVRSVFIP